MERLLKPDIKGMVGDKMKFKKKIFKWFKKHWDETLLVLLLLGAAYFMYKYISGL